MTTMIEALKQAIALADILPPAPGEEANPADILATYAKGALAEYEAALAARDGELLACRLLLTEALEEFADCIPYSQPYFDEKWGYSETLARLKAETQNGARGQQLAELIQAVGVWMKFRNAWLECEDRDYDQTEADYGASKDKLAAAYRACYPENGR